MQRTMPPAEERPVPRSHRSYRVPGHKQGVATRRVDGADGSEAEAEEAAEAAAGLARAPAQALGRAPLVEGGGKGNGVVVVSVAATAPS